MSKRAKAPPGTEPSGEYSAFKRLLGKIAKVPKAEADEQERLYRESRSMAEPAQRGRMIPTARKKRA